MASCAVEYRPGVFGQNETKLFLILNKLENGMRLNPSQSGVAFEAVAALFDFLTHDMALEEEELAHSGSPDAQVYKKENEFFKSTVNTYLSLMQFGSLPPVTEIRDFLANWLKRHIARSQAFERR